MISSETRRFLKKHVPKPYLEIYTSWYNSQRLKPSADSAEIAYHGIYHAERFYRWVFYKYEGKITRKNAAEYLILRNFKSYLRMHKKHINPARERAAKKEILWKLFKVRTTQSFKQDT